MRKTPNAVNSRERFDGGRERGREGGRERSTEIAGVDNAGVDSN